MEAAFDWPISPPSLPIGAPPGSSSINISKAPCSSSWTGVCAAPRCAAGLHSHGSSGNLFHQHADSGTIWRSGPAPFGGTAVSHRLEAAAPQQRL